MLKTTRYWCPAVTVVAIPTMVSKLHAVEKVACKECHMKRLPKAKELPLYEKPESFKDEGTVYSPNSLELQISVVRKQLSKYISAVDNVWKQATDIYDTGLSHSKSTYDYITQEENLVPRIITIASGGLIGLVFATRGGLFKKITYSSVGVTALAAACYPKEAKWCVRYSFSVATETSGRLIKKYTGHDTGNISADAHKKMDSTQPSVNIENMTNTVKAFFSKVYPFDKMSKNKTATGDHGQSKAEDADMYTTRT